MIIDMFIFNLTHIYLEVILINLYHLNNKRLMLILLLDLILNGVPFITIIIILLSFFNKVLFNYLNYNFINKLIVIIIDYFLFGIILYSVFNKFNYYIIDLLLKNFYLNLIVYFLLLKYEDVKYNLIGEKYAKEKVS
jgi:hypothetical protein